MREALFAQDGWGCQHVNQDTNWEVPSSPEPTNKDASGGPPMWKPSINNGTDLWESNLRNGGQPTAQQVPKPSWGHTPSSNLGGTWGEDDDGADSTSVWTGGSSGLNNVAGSGANVGQVVNQGGGGGSGGGVNVGPVGVVVTSGGPPQWGQNVIGVGLGGTGASGTNNLAGTPGGVVPGSGSNATNTGNGWGDPREIRPLAGGGGGNSTGAGSMDIRNVVVDHRGGNGSGGATSNDPRDNRMILDPMRDPIRGDPRGISGRLNGTSEMWGHHAQMSHSQNMQNLNKMAAPAGGGATTGGGPGPNPVSSNIASQWGPPTQGVGVVKDISKQISGWEEPSPPPQRRSIPNYDDGTSLWGQQQQQQQSRVVTAAPAGGGHWKDMTDSIGGRGHLMRGNVPSVGANPMTSVVVGQQSRLSAQHKPEGNTMWMQGGGVRNPPGVVTNTWGDDGHGATSSVSSGNNWSDEKTSQSWSDWGSNNKPNKASASGWSGAGVGPIDGVVELGNDWNPHSVGVGGIIGKTQQQQKLVGMVNVINSDMIKQSKQYRILVENGFKKEDVERALVTANMNIEEAAEMLRLGNPSSSSLVMDGWRRQQQHDDGLVVGSSYSDHSSSATGGNGGGGGFTGRYPVVGSGGQQPSIGFSHNNPMNNMGNTAVAGGGNNNANNMTALQVQKYLNQGGGPHGPQSVVGNTVSSVVSVGFGGQQNSSNPAGGAGAGVGVGAGAGAGAGGTPVNLTSANANNQQPSGQQIRMLGQQIQLAIHSGFISSQILTQPLTQTTLNLLNQLLSNIKHLQAAQQSLARGGNANPMAVNVAISKYKQQIQNLQNQINAQQAVYVKQQQQQNMQPNSQQQQQQQHPSAHLNTSNNDYLRGHDAINNLQNNFTELNINKPSGGYQGASNQQSRLNQWKLPVLDKDIIINPDSSDFSRAPGATKQNLTSNSSNVSSLGLQNDGTWSTGRNIGDGWPDPTSDNENKDWSVVAHQQPNSAAAAAAAATAYTDLVQEFEPGKPWKGSQIKSIEDDPSITPGSVARSPLSINSTPKDADNILFTNSTATTTGKNSPTDLPPLSLSSSTWSFNPNQNFPSWSDNAQQCAATSELWTSPLNKSSSRGPPPGLTVATNKSGNGGGSTSSTPSSTANGWLQQTPRSGGSAGVQTTNTTWTSASGNTSSWGSSWLLLKNLTAQIDGPTLRTLCMQHGPLVSFHLYLNQGIALCKYTTREEANKAQMALNNCVLANTTIFAESPSDNEVQNIMQHLPQQQGASSSANSSVGSSASTSAPSSGSASSNGSGSGGNGNSSNSGNGVSGNNPNSSGNNSNLLSAGGGGGNVSNASSGANTVTSSVNVASNGGGTVGSGTAVSGSKNSGNGSSNIANSTNNSQWRQSSQNQATRPSGREADFDYVSLVYSIVDD